MATKADFTPDEWKLLLQSPLIAGVAISAADPSGLIGMMRESMASARGAHSGQDRSERGCARQGGRK
jgi:hypothetical protein